MIIPIQKMEELQEKLVEIQDQITAEQQKLFSLKSIDNFLKYYSLIKYYQSDVYNLLIDYFKEMKDFEYEIDKETSTQLGINYVMKIGYYYSGQAGFKMKMNLDFAIFWGALIDLLLLSSGLLSKVFYLPISTLVLIMYWSYLRIFYESRNKVFAVRY